MKTIRDIKYDFDKRLEPMRMGEKSEASPPPRGPSEEDVEWLKERLSEAGRKNARAVSRLLMIGIAIIVLSIYVGLSMEASRLPIWQAVFGTSIGGILFWARGLIRETALMDALLAILPLLTPLDARDAIVRLLMGSERQPQPVGPTKTTGGQTRDSSSADGRKDSQRPVE